jgi:hypothetical protein
MQVKQAKQFKRKEKEITIENHGQQHVSSLGILDTFFAFGFNHNVVLIQWRASASIT